jgi:transcriptional regulator with XRE-family HTH domain
MKINTRVEATSVVKVDKINKVNKINNDLRKIIKQRRLMAGLTLCEVSARSGVSVSYLGRIERGDRYPSAAVLRRIAGPLGADEIELLTFAGFLSPQSSSKAGNPKGGQLDSYVALMLSQEPPKVQRAALMVVSMLKYISEDNV